MTNRTDDSVRGELQAAYARAGAAWRAKDAAALMQMVTPDFTQRMPDGQIIPYEIAEAGLKEWLATADRVTDYAVQIGDLTVNTGTVVGDVRPATEEFRRCRQAGIQGNANKRGTHHL